MIVKDLSLNSDVAVEFEKRVNQHLTKLAMKDDPVSRESYEIIRSYQMFEERLSWADAMAALPVISFAGDGEHDEN